MTLLLSVVFILIVAGVVAGLIAGKVAGGLDDPTTTVPPRGFDPGPVTPEEIERLRFVQGLRGYRMDQVDEALARLRDEIVARDEEIAALRARSSSGPAPTFEPASESAAVGSPIGGVALAEAPPVAEALPVVDAPPVPEPAAVVESAEVVESVPLAKPAPIVEPAPVVEPVPVAEAAEVEGPDPVVEPAPVTEPSLVAEVAPVTEPALVAEPTSEEPTVPPQADVDPDPRQD